MKGGKKEECVKMIQLCFKTNIIKLTIIGEIKDARNIECQPFK